MINHNTIIPHQPLEMYIVYGIWRSMEHAAWGVLYLHLHFTRTLLHLATFPVPCVLYSTSTAQGASGKKIRTLTITNVGGWVGG